VAKNRGFMSEKIGEFMRDLTGSGTGRLTIIGSSILIFFIILAAFAPYIAPYDPTEKVGLSLEPPSKQFWFGTDNLGRDILSRVIYGARIALSISFMGVAIAFAIGVPLDISVDGLTGF